MRTITHWIQGKPYERSSERQGDVFDPSTGEVAARVAYASAAEVDQAIAAARTAWPEWRDASLARRTRVLFAFRELLATHAKDVATAIVGEHGKVLADAQGEVTRGQDVVEFACGLAHLLKGEFSEGVSTDVDSYSVRQPLGVVAGITPFNFPIMVPLWMIPVALACGNAFVLKPSEKDPSPSLIIADLLAQAGLPAGVFEVVHGDRVAVERILDHPDIAAVSFVGSTPVARWVYTTGARHGKRVQALAGAKNHMIVLPDADMDLAADGAVSAGYGSAGERCMAIAVVVAVGRAADALLPRMRERIARLRVGPGLDPASEMGPLVTREHRARVAGYVERGVAEGATLLVDGREVRVPGHEGGFWLGPCLFDHVTPEMTIYREEIFGPVLCVVRVETFDDAMTLVSRCRFANGVAVFTNDGGAARKFRNEIPVGMVGINVPIPVPMAYYSFGGWKDSLFGDTHIHGLDGVRFYTRTKTVTARWPDPRHRGVDLGFPKMK